MYTFQEVFTAVPSGGDLPQKVDAGGGSRLFPTSTNPLPLLVRMSESLKTLWTKSFSRLKAYVNHSNTAIQLLGSMAAGQSGTWGVTLDQS